MPLRKIHHPVGAYTAEERKEFAEAITRVYQAVPIPRLTAAIRLGFAGFGAMTKKAP